MRDHSSTAEMMRAGKMSAAAAKVTTCMEVAAAEMSAPEVTTAKMAAAVATAPAMTSTAMAATTAPRKCAAGKDDRKHGDCHDKPGHWHPSADFSAREVTRDGTESSRKLFISA
jgi:hypothetical protein